MARSAVIAGLGPGFCERFAWKLAEEGYGVGAFARSNDYLAGVEAELHEAGHDALAIPADLTDPAQVSDGFEAIREELGPVEVLAYTASVSPGAGGDLDPDRFEQSWRLYAYGGFLCAREALEDMRDGGGTMLFFGAGPAAGDYAYKSGKAAMRSLARSLVASYGPEGVHVSHVVLNGRILNPDVYDGPGEVDEEQFMDPTALVETCWHLVAQDESAWTFELDLQPNVQTDIR